MDLSASRQLQIKDVHDTVWQARLDWCFMVSQNPTTVSAVVSSCGLGAVGYESEAVHVPGETPLMAIAQYTIYHNARRLLQRIRQTNSQVGGSKWRTPK